MAEKWVKNDPGMPLSEILWLPVFQAWWHQLECLNHQVAVLHGVFQQKRLMQHEVKSLHHDESDTVWHKPQELVVSSSLLRVRMERKNGSIISVNPLNAAVSVGSITNSIRDDIRYPGTKEKPWRKNNVAGYDRARVHESMKAKQLKTLCRLWRTKFACLLVNRYLMEPPNK